MKVLRCIVLIFIAVILTACVFTPQTTITSNRAENYAKKPKRIFVLTTISADFGKKMFDSFEKKFIAIANDCDTAVMVNQVNSLELDEKIYAKNAEAFKADTLMVMRPNGGLVSQYGRIFNVIYDIKLMDVSSEQTIWRAKAKFVPGESIGRPVVLGEKLAIDITNKMKNDRLWGACAIIQSDQTGKP